MRRWYRSGLAALAGLVLAGCTERPAAINPADAVALLRTGQPLLNCREPCVAEWRRVQPQAARLEAEGRWTDLAVAVITVGYQDDLALYYLGRAAEGLGYPGAAASYFRQSTYLSGTSVSCQNLSGVCGGLAFPAAAQVRIAAIDRELMSRQRIPRRAAPPRPAPSSQPEPAAVTIDPSPSEPPPPATAPVTYPAAIVPAAPPPPAASPAPPSPLPRRSGPAASEFIEPPAAR